MTNHFTFFASYYDSIEHLDNDLKAEFLDVLLKYALRDESPENMSPVVQALFTMAKPNLDQSKARRKAGAKGGKQSGSKPEAKGKQTGSKPEASGKREGVGEGVGEGKGEGKEVKTPKPTTRTCIMELKPAFFSQEEWEELYKFRTKKKASQEVRAYKPLIVEFEKAHAAGMSADGILNEMFSGGGWKSFKYEWVLNRNQENKAPGGKNGYVEPSATKNYRDGL